jgi:hypothetical protein
MSNAEKILEKIKTDHITPAPRWRVLTMRVLIWLSAIIAVFVGSIAFSIVIFIFANQDADLSTRLNLGHPTFYLAILPYFWVIILALFALGAYFNFRHTKRGYRAPLFAVVGAYIIATVILGALFYRAGVGARIEQMAADTVPYYNQMNYARALWVAPDKGLLAGKILAVTGDQVRLQDLNGDIWDINIASSTGRENISPQSDIKIIGVRAGERTFTASQIRPWCGCSGCMKHRGQSCLDHCRAQTQ